MPTVLLIEDNPHIMNINATALLTTDYEVLCADCLAKGDELLSVHPVDLIVLDVMLPDGDGITWCKRTKAEYSIPILFLSALGESQDIVLGLQAGGDDYLPKPYDLKVFLARVEARLRSYSRRIPLLRVGALCLDTVAMVALLRGEDMLLTQKEFLVLLSLAKASGNVVPKDTLYSHVWRCPPSDDYRALYTVVSRLKKKLRSDETGITITLKRPYGYLLEVC